MTMSHTDALTPFHHLLLPHSRIFLQLASEAASKV